MIGMYSQATKTDRLGTLQAEINSLLEIEPPKKITPPVVNLNDHRPPTLPAWQIQELTNGSR